MLRVFKLIPSIIILYLGIFSYPQACLALEKGKGIIKGSIVNKTPGVSIKESVNITLYQYYLEKEVRAREELRTDPEGKFEINNLATDDNYRYFIVALYKGTEYEIGPLIFGKENKILKVEIPVYEPTSDPSIISIRMHHLIIKVTRENLQVEEYIVFENKDKRTYTGKRKIRDKNAVLEFVLPSGFKNLEPLSGLMSCCTVPTEKGFVDTMPIKPGVREIVFSYLIPYSSSSFELSLPVQFFTENFSLLISRVEGVKLISEDLRNEGAITFKDGKYDIFSTGNLSQGATVRAKLVGLPRKNATFNFALVGLITTLVLVGAIYPLIKRGRSFSMKGVKVTIEKERYLELQRKELLLDIVELERRVSRGEISPGEYAKLREEKKKSLIDITRKLQEFKDKKS